MDLKPGARLQSVTCDTQVAVVKAPGGDVDVRCGGEPMVATASRRRGRTRRRPAEGTAPGKRYTNDDGTVELLCTKAGTGSLSVDGAPPDAQGRQAPAVVGLT